MKDNDRLYPSSPRRIKKKRKEPLTSLLKNLFARPPLDFTLPPTPPWP